MASTSDPTTPKKEEEEEDESRPPAEDEDTGAQVSEVAVTTGQENIDVLLELKAKLYRFVKEVNQWRERGVGVVKLLKDKETKTVRLIMRQKGTLKIRANHYDCKSFRDKIEEITKSLAEDNEEPASSVEKKYETEKKEKPADEK